MSEDADVLVLGGGAAGLSAALSAAAGGRRVLLAVKTELGDGSTRWAQGGLAAALDPDDSVFSHARDTLAAGAGLCDPGAVSELVRAAPQAIAALQRLGARFDTNGGRLALGREGGHQRCRIVHAGGDASGAEVSRTLGAAVRNEDNIDLLERAGATDLLLEASGAVCGARLLMPAGPCDVRARAVVLATGGIGQVFATTTNPPESTGDGLALALRAGATVSDVEFVQFHPTVLWRPGAGGQQPLVTEALRGAGAVLVDQDGRRFLADEHPLAELAPRDVVAAAIHARRSAGDAVFLDGTALGQATLEQQFPTVLAACRAAGVDPVTDPIPVAPGAHYHCGGVLADLAGATDVPGLFAVGEVAATGAHGANRLASNSLTEALISGSAAGRRLAERLPDPRGREVAPAPTGRKGDPVAREAITAAMSRHAGVLRDDAGLTALLAELAQLPSGTGPVTRESAEAANLQQVAHLIASAAHARRESRGCHRRGDAPAAEAQWDGSLRWRLTDGVLAPRRTRWGRAA